MTRISVIGTGYLGTTHAACMASLGHEVFAFDIDQNKVESLSKGFLPFFEPKLAELISNGLSSRRLKFSSNLNEVIQNSEVHFICVGTPQLDQSGAADTSQIFNAIDSILPLIKQGDVLVGKSTVPVGTASKINEIIKSSPEKNLSLVWNPEFLREGFAVNDTLNPDRIVLGSDDADAIQHVLDIYRNAVSKGTPIIKTDFATSELVKVAANAFLATKISFINAFADLCDVTGANVTVLADAIGMDSRIGRKFLNAGIGFGGGCLPKDIRALRSRSIELGLLDQFAFLEDIDQINSSRIEKVIALVLKSIGSVGNKKIAILGASFKPNSDDTRNSPALDIAEKFIELGANVMVHDPVAVDNVKRTRTHINASDSIDLVLAKADITLHLTEWDEYRKLNPVEMGNLVANKKLIDGRNVLEFIEWQSAGWEIIYLGKKGQTNIPT